MYNAHSQIKFITSILKSSLCDHSDPYILVKGSITITEIEADATAREGDERKKEVIFRNYAPLTNCISKMNNAQVDNAKDVDVVMLMYDLIEYSNNYSKNPEVYGNITEMNQILRHSNPN